MYTFDQYIWLEITNSYTTKQLIFFHQLVLHILCKLLCNDILFMHTTYRPNISSVLLQFKDWISENMKISK